MDTIVSAEADAPRIIPTALHEVAPDKIEAAWPALEPLVATFIDETLHTVEDVRGWLLSGGMKLWVAGTRNGIEAIAVVEPLQHTKGRCLVVWGCAAGPKTHSDRWLAHLDQIERMAKEKYGCIKVRIEGRKGWARRLPSYRLAGYIMEKDL